MLNEEMKDAIEQLKEAAIADYDRWSRQGSDSKISAEMSEQFAENLSFIVGRKYIKITSAGSAWAFIVNTKNDAKFEYGDILKSASWAAPARNSARGNVFGDYTVRWTGPLYLR